MERKKFDNLVTFFENQHRSGKKKTDSSPRDSRESFTSKKDKCMGFYDGMIHDIDSLIGQMIVKNICEFEQK
jgi:hypothetical protein